MKFPERSSTDKQSPNCIIDLKWERRWRSDVQASGLTIVPYVLAENFRHLWEILPVVTRQLTIEALFDCEGKRADFSEWVTSQTEEQQRLWSHMYVWMLTDRHIFYEVLGEQPDEPLLVLRTAEGHDIDVAPCDGMGLVPYWEGDIEDLQNVTFSLRRTWELNPNLITDNTYPLSVTVVDTHSGEVFPDTVFPSPTAIEQFMAIHEDEGHYVIIDPYHRTWKDGAWVTNSPLVIDFDSLASRTADNF